VNLPPSLESFSSKRPYSKDAVSPKFCDPFCHNILAVTSRPKWRPAQCSSTQCRIPRDMELAEKTSVSYTQVHRPKPCHSNVSPVQFHGNATYSSGPSSVYAYDGMAIAEAGPGGRAVAISRPRTDAGRSSSGWCDCCCGPCARWSRRCWIIIILVVVVLVSAAVAALVLTIVAQNNGGSGNGTGYRARLI
jgi:hypothetical protein